MRDNFFPFLSFPSLFSIRLERTNHPPPTALRSEETLVSNDAMRIVQRQDAVVRQQTAQLDGPHVEESRPVHTVLSQRGE